MEQIMETKAQLRERMKKRRDAMPKDERAAKSDAIARRIMKLDWYSYAAELLVYAAIRSEVELFSFCEMAWRDGRILYFPRVSGEDMEFYRVDSFQQLAPGCFQVPEPRLIADSDFAESSDSLAGEVWSAGSERTVPILVPGIAFSRQGQRIGYGKGYYDRYLAKHPALMPIGICFEEQLVDGMETEAQDYPMRRIVTERDVYEAP